MHISIIKALTHDVHAAASVARPKRFTLPSELVVLVPMVIACFLLALLEVRTTAMFDPNMLWITPE